MLKRIMGVLVVAMLTLSLCACGSNGNSAASSSKTSEYDPAVDTIDLTLDKGSVRFVRAEKANANLTDSENAYVFVLNSPMPRTSRQRSIGIQIPILPKWGRA